jgi:hypothetical protein
MSVVVFRVFSHLGLEVVLDATEDGEAGDEHRVRVISFCRMFAKFDQSVDSAESQQVSTHGRIVAQSETEIKQSFKN